MTDTYKTEIVTTLLMGVLKDNSHHIGSKKLSEARNEIRSALLEDRLTIIKNDTHGEIGFFTWHSKEDGSIFINNMCILKKHRNKNNFLSLRSNLRDLFGSKKLFYWKNRRRNHVYKTY